MKIQLKNVRLAFPDLFKARAFSDEQEAKFGATFLLDKTKDAAQIEAVRNAMKAVMKEKWGDKPPKLAPEKVCLQDGDLKDYDGFANTRYIHATSDIQQKVVDGALQELNERSGLIYGGCYVNASINIWAMDNKWGKRLNASLGAVQFAGHGESFGGGGKQMDPAEEFEAYEKPKELGDLDEGSGFGGEATGKTVQQAIKDADADLPF